MGGSFCEEVNQTIAELLTLGIPEPELGAVAGQHPLEPTRPAQARPPARAHGSPPPTTASPDETGNPALPRFCMVSLIGKYQRPDSRC